MKEKALEEKEKEQMQREVNLKIKEDELNKIKENNIQKNEKIKKK